MAKPRHRHERSSWLICGGNVEWCYQCGAWRNLQRTGPASLARIPGPDGNWNKPTGIGGPNPAIKEPQP